MISRRFLVVRLLPLLLGARLVHARQGSAGPAVQPGIDVLQGEGFARLRGLRVALLTNLAAQTRTGQLTVDAVRGAGGVQLAALFAPEHGLEATADSDIASGRDARTGLQVHSLYGATQRPTAAMLDGIDLILIDLPDVGARFYTYMTTMAYVMEEAARHRVAVMVLDRPNPITGGAVEGPMLDGDLRSFVGYFPMPVRHGLTLGELARLFNGEARLGASLTVVPVTGWRRSMWHDDTGLPWSNPSPNIRNLRAAALYPGLGAIEWSNISVGRGTDTPFELIGAPWMDGPRIALILNSRRVPGVTFAPASFTPSSSVYANQRCSGVSLSITDRNALRPVRVGIEVAAALRRQHPAQFNFGKTAQLLGSRDTIARLQNGEDPAVIAALWTADEARWREQRASYLLY
jgi:uncharacterized protein YbbC (DUF1343 family)